VLPLYIALMTFFPPVLWLMLRKPDLTLLLSIVFYFVAKTFDWNLVLYPYDHSWFFNPFAWQLLFVIGAWCALGGAQRTSPVLNSPPVIALCVVFLLLAAPLQLSWLFPSLSGRMPSWLMILPLDKTGLSGWRLAHFLALATLVIHYVPFDAKFLRSNWARPLILCGQNSLEIFCLGVFLSFSAHFVLTEISGLIPMQILVSAAGIAVMVTVAALMTWYKDVERRGGKPPPSATQEGLGRVTAS